MKSIYFSVFLYFCISFCGQTNFKEEFNAVLMEDIILQETEGLIKAQLFEQNKKKEKTKDITLLGQVRAVSPPSKQDAKIIQVVWTSVKRKDKKKASFKKPLISTFKSEKGILSKGLKISLHGDKDQLVDAIGRLEKGEDDLESEELQANNPSSIERRLEDIDAKLKNRQSSRNNNALSADSGVSTLSDNNLMSLSTESYRGINSSSYGEGKNADSLIRKPSNSQDHLSTRRRAGSLRNFNRQTSQLKGSPSAPQLSAISQTASPHDNKHALSSSPNQHYNKNFIEGSKDAFGPLTTKQGDALGVDEFKMPVIEVEVTKEGCTPRIDLERGKVIIQTRSISRTNGAITHETQCTDSHLIFDIKKDYSCCSDIVDQQAQVSYTTFKRYWIDEGNNKVYLDDHCLKDESQPHPFIEEKGLCSHEINLQSRLAYPQAETVYYDRSNARKLVKVCHRTNESPSTIVLTEQGCSLKHFFEQNKSIVQKRNIFIENGVTHEVTPCHETNESIAHQFIKAGCKPVVNRTTVIPMAKRHIYYKDKTKLISEQCEPQDLTDLLSTKEGCEGQYEHDYTSGRSYPLIRHYYQWNGKKRFIDKVCKRSNEPIPHLLSIVGYEHIDLELKSKPRYQVSIEDQKRKLILQEVTESNRNKWIPYSLKETVERPSQKKGPQSQENNLVFENDKIEVWMRPDGTLFEKVIGGGTLSSISIVPNDGSGKTVISITEQVILPGPYVGGRRYKVRKVTRYSDGSVDFGRPFIRVVPDSGQYINDYHSAPNFYFEKDE
ncbi:MAG: hypothetical protein BGO77_03150 [Caedibacter sp. 37-49]|nr:MAG: hypothetical protein BGO77_03150 [Caedibacter sp. 37-49]